jgi:hypothetical protein
VHELLSGCGVEVERERFQMRGDSTLINKDLIHNTNNAIMKKTCAPID